MFSSYHILLSLYWVLYAFIHSVMASLWFKNLMAGIMGKQYKYYRFIYSIIAFVTLAAVLGYQFSRQSLRLFQPGAIFIAVAWLLSLAGVAVMLISGRKYLLTITGADVFKHQPSAHKLEQEGLHSYIRHPVYSGTILLIWALFIIFPLLSNLIACVIITVYTLIGIGMEERKLVLEFGDSYINYARKTPMLIPFTGKKQAAEKHDNG